MNSPILVMMALVVAPLLGWQTKAASRPLLDGSWLINKELSSARRGSSPDPGDTLSPPVGRRGMRGGFGDTPGGGARGTAPDREEIERRRALMREVLEPPQRFLITVEDVLVIFTYPDGRVVRYKADGKEERHQYPSGTVKTKAKWETDRLAIETNLGDGVKVTHTFRTTAEPRQLVVTTLLPGQSKDLPPVTHTYDETPQ